MAQSVIINGVTYPDVPQVNIPLSGGGTAEFYDTTDATVATSDLLPNVTAYGASGKITGNMPTQGAQTITPSTTDQTVASGKYLTGAITVLGDADLIGGNIKSGASIFGVSGSSMVLDTTIASSAATAAYILSGYKAYANGSLITGNMNVPTVSQDASTKVLSIS